jgi:hypothetical protein
MGIWASIMIAIPLWLIALELKRFNDFKNK